MKVVSIILFGFVLVFHASTLTAANQVTVETITVPFNASGGVAIDDTGLVYVADFGQALNFANGTNVYQILDDGTIITFATGLSGASGNAFDSEGNLFQSNIAAHSVSKILPDGTAIPWAFSGIVNPVGIAINNGDTVFVSNCGSNSIARILPNATSSVWASSSLLQCPNGLTIDENGNLYACNFANGNIIKIDTSGSASILATLPGGRCGHLTYFEGVIYAVARCSHQIYQVTLDGVVTLLAGSGARGNADGPAETATFNHPNGIEAKRVGDNIELYVNDAVSLTGDCTTVPLNPVVIRKITIYGCGSEDNNNNGIGDLCEDCCGFWSGGMTGNVDNDILGELNISDLVLLVDYMFGETTELPCPEDADVDINGVLDIADLVYLVSFMFDEGPLPSDCL